MNILLLHGYGLDRSGSNVFIKNLARNLCDQGHNVHLFCQASLEEAQNECNSYYEYNSKNKVKFFVEDNSFQCSGNLYIHKADISILLVYNMDKYNGFEKVTTYTQASKEELETYFVKNASLVRKICMRYQIDIVLANHILGMPEVARRATHLTGVPFVINPHGSSIEYSIRGNDHFKSLCRESFIRAKAIVVGSEEMKRRIEDIWGTKFNKKFIQINMGVNTSLFNANDKITELQVTDREFLEKRYSKEFFDEFYEQQKSVSAEKLNAAMTKNRDHFLQNKSDKDYTEKVNANKASKKIVYAGKMIVGKGVHNLIFAVAQAKNIELMLAGEGTFRPCLELLVRALQYTDYNLFKTIVTNGPYFDGKPKKVMASLERYLNQVEFTKLSEMAQQNNLIERVKFLGFLTHEQLVSLYKVCHYLFLPSEVKEAYPLCLIEAAACGLLPLATDTGGNKEFLNRLSANLFKDEKSLVIASESNEVVGSIHSKIETIKDVNFSAAEMSEYVHKNYDVKNITKQYLNEFSKLVYGDNDERANFKQASCL